jgi:hypothetical protein
MENQIITKEQLDSYTNELVEIDDYQGAVIMNLLFYGINIKRQTDLCELSNIKISDIDFDNNTITTIKRTFTFGDRLKKLIEGAIEQTRAIDYNELTQISSTAEKKPKHHWFYTFHNFNYLVRSKKKSEDTENEPTNYAVICTKLSAISEYINNPYINPTYLNLSGMIDYIKNNYSEDDYDRTGKNAMQMYEEIIETFNLESSVYNLKARLLPFLQQ